jgi:hypothetical protein
MLLQRVLTLLAGATVALCLGLGLLIMAFGSAEKPSDAGPDTAAIADAKAAAPDPLPADDRAKARRRIEEQIAAAPEYARFFERLRESFPSDYDSTLDGLAVRFAKPEQQEGADLYLSEAVRHLRQGRGVLAAKADMEPLAKVFQMQLEVLRAVGKEDARLCVAFLYGATSQDFQRFAATRRSLMGETALAGLEAIVNGQEKKVERPAPSETDFKLLETSLAQRGLDKLEIGALLDGKMPDPPLEDARMCAAGQTYFEVLGGLPEPARLRIYGLAVELMARS